MKAFVPVPDDLDPDPRLSIDRLVPYRAGLPCLHWEAVIDADGVRRYFSAPASDGRPAPVPASPPSPR